MASKKHEFEPNVKLDVETRVRLRTRYARNSRWASIALLGCSAASQPLRGEPVSLVRHKPCAVALRADPHQGGRGVPHRGVTRRGAPRNGLARRLFWGSRRPQQGAGGGPSRARGTAACRADRTSGQEARQKADLLCELQARVRARGDAGDHSGGAGYQDHGQKERLHVRFLDQPAFGRLPARIKDL